MTPPILVKFKSAAVVAVLVVPADGDPGGLLAAARLGASPPMVTPPMCRPEECDARGLISDVACWRPHPVIGWKAFDGCALPLWWDGALVPEGWDRARRVFYANGAPHRVSFVRAGNGTNPALWFVDEVADLFVEGGIAARVVRLTRDADGRLVEAL